MPRFIFPSWEPPTCLWIYSAVVSLFRVWECCPRLSWAGSDLRPAWWSSGSLLLDGRHVSGGHIWQMFHLSEGGWSPWCSGLITAELLHSRTYCLSRHMTAGHSAMEEGWSSSYGGAGSGTSKAKVTSKVCTWRRTQYQNDPSAFLISLEVGYREAWRSFQPVKKRCPDCKEKTSESWTNPVSLVLQTWFKRCPCPLRMSFVLPFDQTLGKIWEIQGRIVPFSLPQSQVASDTGGPASRKANSPSLLWFLRLTLLLNKMSLEVVGGLEVIHDSWEMKQEGARLSLHDCP